MDTVYKESVHYFADAQLDLKTGVRVSLNNNFGAIPIAGPVDKAIRLAAQAKFPLVKPYCLSRPSNCFQGLSVAFWLKYPGQTITPGFFLRYFNRNPLSKWTFKQQEGIGFRAHSNGSGDHIDTFVSSQTHRCTYRYVTFLRSFTWQQILLLYYQLNSTLLLT